MPSIVHKYKAGTSAFCFEPDPSKAKLIYFAKIKQLCGYSSTGRSRVPLYFVHFLGWKNKWDRLVPENLLMDINHFTKMLKLKIDELASNIKDKEIRKERIDTVLMSAAKARDDVDWDTLPGTWQKNEKPIKARTSYSSGESQQPSQEPSDAVEEIDFDSETTARHKFESLDAHLNFAPIIKLPKALRVLLNRHYLSLARSTSTVSSWCSVLYLLQTYLNGFPYLETLNNSMALDRNNMNLFPSTVFRERFSKAAAAGYAKTDRSKVLCAEFCSSVRILFDALLEQYFFKIDEDRRHQNLAVNGPEIPVRGQYTILPKEEIARDSSLPCLNYGAIYILRLLQNLRDLINQMPLSQCRRSVVLRHLYLFIAYLNGTRDFWFTATPPDTPAPLSPASAITSAGDSISTRAAFANVVGSVMSVVPSDPAPSTPATGRRPRSSDSNSATLPQPIKRQQRFYAFDSAPRAEMNDNGSKEKSSANPLVTATVTAPANSNHAAVQRRSLRSQGASNPETTITKSINGNNSTITTVVNASNSRILRKTSAANGISTVTSVKAETSRQSISRRSEKPKSTPKRRLTRSTISRMTLRSSRL